VTYSEVENDKQSDKI